MPEFIEHTLAPVYDERSRILILGTMPSPRSRKDGFYYGHPRNRFWRVLADVFAEPVPADNREKENFVLRHGIALWDVLQSCRINGADDSSITDPVPNDISHILENSNILVVFTTGQKAADLYKKYCFPKTGIAAVSLPSTSPANARLSYEDIVSAYRVIICNV